jgi:hypothetical protein
MSLKILNSGVREVVILSKKMKKGREVGTIPHALGNRNPSQ